MSKTLTETEQLERFIWWVEKFYWIGVALLLFDRDLLGLETIFLSAGLLWLMLISEGGRLTALAVFQETARVITVVGGARALGIV